MSPQPSLSSRLARKVARVIPIRRKRPETTSVTKVLSQPSDEDSFGRRARDYGIIGLSFALPLSEAVPVVGGAIKAAIGGLLEVLKLVERITQNKEDASALAYKLYDLLDHISEIPIARMEVNDSRSALKHQLNRTTEELSQIGDYSRVRSATISNILRKCSDDINFYLARYTALSNMRLENAMDIHERRIEYLQRFMQDMVSYQQVMSISMGVLKLIDGAGRAHAIPMTFAMSFEQLNETIRVLFLSRKSEADNVLLQFVQKKMYDLCVNSGREVTRVEDNSTLSVIQPGTTIVMRILLVKQEWRLPMDKRYVTYPRVSPGALAQTMVEDELGVSSTECHRRGIQFQISDEPGREVGTGETSDTRPHHIRHIHIKNVPGELSRAIRYLIKIKARFSDDSNSYKQYQYILQAYAQLYVQVQMLYKDALDLFAEVTDSVPEVVPLNITYTALARMDKSR